MSSFLSNKFLKYRSRDTGGPIAITIDRPCTNCSYNLRGLTIGKNCPECGTPIKERELDSDVLLAGDLDQRAWLVRGLTLVCLCPIVIVALRMGASLSYAFAHSIGPDAVYQIGAAGVFAMWSTGVWLTTGTRLGVNHQWLNRGRSFARWSQLLWLCVAGAACIVMAAPNSPSARLLLAFAAIAVTIALPGALVYVYWLMTLADDGGLIDAAAAINLSLWISPFTTIIAALVPVELPWFAFALLLAILLPWCWYLLKFSRGAWDMRQHVSWSMRLVGDRIGRETRIGATRAELDREARSIVRPLPGDSAGPDVPVSDPPAPRR